MASLLLETKIYVPKVRRGLVPRPRLGERLNRGAQSKLTLVSAPAGFGKTTLLAGWLGLSKHAVASLSLEQSDNHAALFWNYLVAALQTAEPGIGASAISLLQWPQPPAIEAVLTLLLNELSAMSTDVVLVLDDYHVIDARDIHDGVAFCSTISRRGYIWRSPAAPTRRCRWLVSEHGANWLRSALPICVSHPTRPPHISVRRWLWI
jgi:LuxR family maltose regulon positive regulatory protein